MTNSECCSLSISLSFKGVFYVGDEESGGDEGETANVKQEFEVPEGREERRQQVVVRLDSWLVRERVGK